MCDEQGTADASPTSGTWFWRWVSQPESTLPFVQWKPSHFLISPESESGRQSLRPLGSLEPGLEVVMGAAGLQMKDKEEI